ncbi:MAG TPA: hypothetical protein DGT58_03660, partial [Erysipelotrichaceae bacterium]|nr:hypothetical protein [Erysipelotrichaceae bacterium]
MLTKSVIQCIAHCEENLIGRIGKIQSIAIGNKCAADFIGGFDAGFAAFHVERFTVFIGSEEGVKLNCRNPSFGKQSTVLLDVCHKMRDRI